MLKNFLKLFFLSIALNFSCGDQKHDESVEVTGELNQWHKVVLIIEGLETGENDSINPFLDYRLNVKFWKNKTEYLIPGYYAADGYAAESGADTGNKWKVNFCPDDYGVWNYRIYFSHGRNIAVNDDPEVGKKMKPDGFEGQLTINPSNKTGTDFRAKGRIIYSGSHFLRHAGTGKVFLKTGADSPENLLAYQDFDGTYYGGWNDSTRRGEAEPLRQLHRYAPHIKDWNEGDPSWRNGKGKGLIGALNYLSSAGMNSVYMLTNNVGGDGKEVFPWTTYNSDFTRYDVSKLEQWEIVFSHMDKLGLMCHFVTQEHENQLLLDSGNLGITRKLYYRELIARYGHHLGITWNLGEENGPSDWSVLGQNDQQQRNMAEYIKQHDPYKSFVVIHTHSSQTDREKITGKLLGFPYLDGISMQSMVESVHSETLRLKALSSQKGRKWVISSDEIGPADTGAKPDAADPLHNAIRHEVLWGNLMAGGGGVEWYFGYNYPNNDLNCEDWRSREILWRQSKIARDFFEQYIDMDRLVPADEFVVDGKAYCVYLPDDEYAVYIPQNASCGLKTKNPGSYLIGWYNPVSGGEVVFGDTLSTDSLGIIRIENSIQKNSSHDWTALLRILR
ncbi:MAG TPA: DUF5060 domain-containing protein [Cyclobacteriaceae bacterium]|nr:DUF5060 domain-containing protein [Cyclobacteriaceae bacterium]